MAERPWDVLLKVLCVFLAVLSTCIGLTACGGSSDGSQSHTAFASTAPTPAGDKVTSGSSASLRDTRLANPAFRHTLMKFAACLRENGVNIPPANILGSGPVLNTNGINTNSIHFKMAWTKCRGRVDLGKEHFYRPAAMANKHPGSRGP